MVRKELSFVRMKTEMNYNYAYHGSYSTYLRNVKAQFQLDCLPDYVKYGSNLDNNNNKK